MEILKGFSWDIQRFAEKKYDLTKDYTIAALGASAKVFYLTSGGVLSDVNDGTDATVEITLGASAAAGETLIPASSFVSASAVANLGASAIVYIPDNQAFTLTATNMDDTGRIQLGASGSARWVVTGASGVAVNASGFVTGWTDTDDNTLIQSGNFAFASGVTTTSALVSAEASVTSEKGDSVTASTSGRFVVTAGEIALTSGTFTTASSSSLEVKASNAVVGVNGSTFTANSSGTYTYGSSATVNAASTFTKASADSITVIKSATDVFGVTAAGAVTVKASAATSAIITALTSGTVTTSAATTFTYDIDGTAGGTDDILFTNFKGSLAATGATTAPDVATFTAGSIAASAGINSLKIGDTTFTNGSGGVSGMTFGTDGTVVGLTAGSVKLTSGSLNVMAAGGTIVAKTVTINSSTDGIVVTANNDGTPVVTDLATPGETVTIGTTQYKVINNGVIGATIDGKTTYYKVSATGYREGGKDSVGTPLATADTAAIVTSLYKTDGTYNFNEIGLQVSDGTAASLVVSSGSKKLTVKTAIGSAAADGVNAAGDKVEIEDKGTNTVYTLSDTSEVTANGASFTTDSGVVTGSKGTLVINAAAKSLVAKGAVNVDATAIVGGTGKVTFQEGTAVSGAKVTLNKTNDIYMTLTEASNSSSDAVATVYDGATKTLKGIDGDATLIMNGVTATQLATVTTTGSGTFTQNKTAYTVAEDSNGVTYHIGGTDAINQISGLDRDATVALSGKQAFTTFTVGSNATGTAFTNLEVSNGVTFTSTDAAQGATATLFAKGDKVTYNGWTYEVSSMGSASDGIVVGSNGTTLDYLNALNDGDSLTITDGTSTFVYEANNSMLTVKYYATAAKYTALTPDTTTTYTLDSGESAFTVTAAVTANNWVVKNGTKGEGFTGTGATFGTVDKPAAVTSLTNGMYVNSNGETSLSDTKAVAQISVTDSTVTYTATSDKAQSVAVASDTKGREDWVVNTRNGKDVISFNNVNADITVSSGAGADEVYIGRTAATKGDAVIEAGEGKDTITIGTFNTGDMTISAGAGNDTVTASGFGDYVINMDSGNNEVYHTGSGDATIVGGTGKDTIQGRKDDVITGGDGEDTFIVYASKSKIDDYTYGTDVLMASSTSGAVTIDPTKFGATGTVSVTGAGSTVYETDLTAGTGTGEYYAVSLVDVNGKNATNVAWAKEGGSNIDILSYEKAVTMIGNEDGANTLYAGKKDDVIYSYADNDSVYGGEGKDTLTLKSKGTGRVVGIATTSSKDTVTGFTAGFEENDSIAMVDGNASDVKATFDSSKKIVTFKDGDGSLELQGIEAASTGAAEVVLANAKVAVATEGGTVAATSAKYADAYIGKNSTVSFASVDGEVNVDLRNDLSSTAEGTKFSGVVAVAGGSGKNTLIGGTGAETITAGTGDSSLWGGAGKDTLVAGAGKDVFFIGTGDGADVITGFAAAGNENADTLSTLSDITGAKLTSNGVEISVSDTDKAILKGVTADTAIKFSSNGNAGVAKVGSSSAANNFTYDKSVTYYGGGSKSDKISLASGFSDDINVWLDGSQGVAYASIDVVDAANSTGNAIIAGDSSSQSIVGGKGSNSLWGGAGSASDTLRSSAGGSAVFFWGMGEGNDVAISSSADDSVNLYSVKLADVDLTNTEITNSGVTLALNDGSKLTVQTSRDITFTVDGTSWTAQHNSKSWKQNS